VCRFPGGSLLAVVNASGTYGTVLPLANAEPCRRFRLLLSRNTHRLAGNTTGAAVSEEHHHWRRHEDTLRTRKRRFESRRHPSPSTLKTRSTSLAQSALKRRPQHSHFLMAAPVADDSSPARRHQHFPASRDLMQHPEAADQTGLSISVTSVSATRWQHPSTDPQGGDRSNEHGAALKATLGNTSRSLESML
jgi:hypothetical protein